MAKNRIRGKPKKRTNHPRDSDIARQIERDIEELIKKGIKYVTVNKKQLIPYITFAYAGDMISYIYIYI